MSLLALLIACATSPLPLPEEGAAEAPPEAPDPRLYTGGEGTVFDRSPLAFSLALRTLDRDQKRAFAVGNALFNDNWVTAPASTEGRDGLGPLFNARSCSSCHIRDGRGRPPLTEGEELTSLLVRLSLPGQDERGRSLPDPRYGTQLQDHAIQGVPAEAELRLRWEPREVEYADGSTETLQRPLVEFTELAYGPLAEGVLTSPRIANAVFGLGLIEAVPEETLLALADPEDRDGDGISGRVNRVWSEEHGEHLLGRFGWKANEPSLRSQSAGAFLGDIGITSSLHPSENVSPAQQAAAAAPTGGSPELDDHKLQRLTVYLQTLAPPARRSLDDPSVQAGEQHFLDAGCASCHLPELHTDASHPLEVLHHQVIRPYSDFLLHDMGQELADGRPDHLASGSEWRTAPLWGLGLQSTVNGHQRLLHDGRADGVAEAILWHGGEAEPSREAFRQLSAEDRAALVAFVESL